MAQLLVSAAFAGVGSAMGWGIPLLGMTGAQVGWAVGSLVGNALFAEDTNIVNEGPRLDDLRVTSSAYGQMRAIGYGVYPVPGNLFDGSELYEEKHKTSQSSGKGGPSTTSTQITYTYSVDLAIGLGEGPIGGVLQVYANEQLIYDATPGSSVTQPDWLKMTEYLGSEIQEPDPTLEAIHGAGNVPAYRGEAYVVFERFELAAFGNRPPNFRFVVASAASELLTHTDIDLAFENAPTYIGDLAENSATGLVFCTALRSSPTPFMYAVDPYTRQVRQQYVDDSGAYSDFRWICFGAYPEQMAGIWLAQPDTHVAVVSKGPEIARRYISILDAVSGASLGVFEAPALYDSNIEVISAYRRDLVLYSHGHRYVFSLGPGGILEMNQYEIYVPADWQGGITQNALGAKRGEYLNDAVICWGLKHTTTADTYAVGLVVDKRDIYGPEVGYEPQWMIVQLPAGSAEPASIAYDESTDLFVVFEKGLPGIINDGHAHERVRIHLISPDGVLVDTVDWYAEYGDAAQCEAPVSVDSASGEIYLAGSDFVSAMPGIYRWSIATQEAPRVYASLTITGRGCLWHRTTSTCFMGLDDLSGAAPALRGYHLNRLQAGTMSLQTVVEDICARRGLQPAQYDATALAARQVRGYRITRQMSGKAALQPLRTAYLFDVSKHDGVLEFVPRGQASSATLGADDLGAHPYGETPPDDIGITRRDDELLPSSIGLTYMNADANYEQGYQLAHRLAADTKTPHSEFLPLVLTDDEAAQLADILVHLPAIERFQYEIAAMPGHRDINPANVIILAPGSREHTMRVTEKTFERGVVRLRGRRDESSIYTSYLSGGATINTAASINMAGITLLFALDIPMLRDQDGDAGFYLAAMSYSPNWPGCVVYQSHDGADYGEICSLTTEAAVGYAINTPASAAPYVWDRQTALEVSMITGELSSVTADQCLAEVNTAVYGAPGRWELVLFQTAGLQADGTYVVTNLVRGMRGTEWAIDLHQPGDKFIALASAAMQRIAVPVSDINQVRYLRPVTVGRTLVSDTSPVTSLTLAAEALKPWAPVNIAAIRDGSDNIVFTWDRQDRIKTQAFWQPQLSEESESYEVDILNGSTVLRTLTVSAVTATYSAADQNTDWGALATSFTVHVYQKSATVGRGSPGQLAVSL